MSGISADLEKLAAILNALGHPVRLALAFYLSRSKKGVIWEALRNSLVEYGLECDVSTLNYHLSVLVKSGVVAKVRTKEGIWVYKLSREARSMVRELRKKSFLKNATSTSKREGKGDAERADRGEVHIERGSVGDIGEEVEGVRARAI